MRRKPHPPMPDPRPSWMIEQGARCGCRGTDDMCPCQNETPWPHPAPDWKARALSAKERVRVLERALEIALQHARRMKNASKYVGPRETTDRPHLQRLWSRWVYSEGKSLWDDLKPFRSALQAKKEDVFPEGGKPLKLPDQEWLTRHVETDPDVDSDAFPELPSDVTITRAEARRLVNYAFMASNANWTPFIRENGVGGDESPWVEFMRIASRLWKVLFPDHEVWQIDQRLPKLPSGGGSSNRSTGLNDVPSTGGEG